MTALYIILAVVAVIMLLLLIPADCILEFSYNNKENNGSVIIKYAFLKFKIFPNCGIFFMAVVVKKKRY